MKTLKKKSDQKKLIRSREVPVHPKSPDLFNILREFE